MRSTFPGVVLVLGLSAAPSCSGSNESSEPSQSAHAVCSDSCASKASACGHSESACLWVCERSYEQVQERCLVTLEAVHACESARASELCESDSSTVCARETLYHTVCLETGGTDGCGPVPEFNERCSDFDLPANMIRCSDLAPVPEGCVAPLPDDAPDGGVDPFGLTYYCCPLE